MKKEPESIEVLKEWKKVIKLAKLAVMDKIKEVL
jgi:hypothetical protein